MTDRAALPVQITNNSILPLVARNISAVAADVAPANHVERLTKGARANALRCLSLTAELIRIVDLLHAAGVQAMPYKGPVLAVDAYEDVTLREFEDLDIIVRQRDMAKADEVVQKLGSTSDVVSKGMYDLMMSSESIGKFFGKMIRPKFPCKKLEPEKPAEKGTAQ